MKKFEFIREGEKGLQFSERGIRNVNELSTILLCGFGIAFAQVQHDA